MLSSVYPFAWLFVGGLVVKVLPVYWCGANCCLPCSSMYLPCSSILFSCLSINFPSSLIDCIPFALSSMKIPWPCSSWRIFWQFLQFSANMFGLPACPSPVWSTVYIVRPSRLILTLRSLILGLLYLSWAADMASGSFASTAGGGKYEASAQLPQIQNSC